MDSKNKYLNIPAANFAKLMTIFSDKSWDIDNGDNDCSVFNRFCTALSVLTEEEQALVLELTENFTKIEFEDYMVHLREVLNKFIQRKRNKLSDVRNIFIAPLISPLDFGKPKSSITVQYLIRSVIHTFPELTGKRFTLTNGLEVEEEIFNRSENILLLVDDFVGGGGTALESVQYLEEIKGISKDKFSILTIATLEKGEKVLLENNIEIYYALKFRRGISDYYDEDVLQEKIAIMESIESKIKPHKKEEFGYDRSEALITLIRTPNNTFPIFWKEKKGRLAPFPR